MTKDSLNRKLVIRNFTFILIKICLYISKHIFLSMILKDTSYIKDAIIDKQSSIN
jgi:hypothetical protein